MSEGLLLIAIASVGSGALAALAWVLGFNASRQFHDEAHARLLVSGSALGEDASTIILSQDKRFAVWRSGKNTHHVSFFLGDKLTTRPLSLRNIARAGERLIIVDCGDIGFPKRMLEADPSTIGDLFGASGTQVLRP
jgi:hypothetical protein